MPHHFLDQRVLIRLNGGCHESLAGEFDNRFVIEHIALYFGIEKVARGVGALAFEYAFQGTMQKHRNGFEGLGIEFVGAVGLKASNERRSDICFQLFVGNGGLANGLTGLERKAVGDSSGVEVDLARAFPLSD